MKILVTTKRVTDPEATIRLKADASGIVEDDLKFAANPFDENAIEAALDIADDHDGEVVVVSIGPDEVDTYIRTALAMGADRGIRVEGDDLLARTLAALYKQEEPDIFLLGKQCIDGDSNQVAQLLAEYLGLPQACFASEIEVEDGKATVAREVDGGIETIEVDLPAVISADLRLNEPRYASLPGIMRAKRKQLDVVTMEELGVDTSMKVLTKRYEAPSTREAGVMVADVAELMSKLTNEAKVL